ncbi:MULTISPECIES: hypothetical protein [Alphaproteobacteria]|jgi:mercuric ion transport protein|uniref:Mercuric ion transport protein n=1 Tax=Maricaulis virginensis TaxID=144022 RepID=A0A9W6IRL0_9PROT|nr:hypothetical protein [Maricaulis virginensis]GLK53940.1 hypothetical protein GCM10017621_34480 [Maricaulis virginensis]
MANSDRNTQRLSPLLSGGGALGGFFAFLGASCCIIPILLVQAGVATGLVARLAWFARWQTEIFWSAAGLLALAPVFALWRGRPGGRFWIWWGVGAALLTAAAILPHYELRLQSWLLDWTGR